MVSSLRNRMAAAACCAALMSVVLSAPGFAGKPLGGEPPIITTPITSFEIGGCGEVVFDEICTKLFRFDDGGYYIFSGLDQHAVGDRLHVAGTVCLTCLLSQCGTSYSAFMTAKVTECVTVPINPHPTTIPFHGCLTVAMDEQCGVVLQAEEGYAFLGLGHVDASQVGKKFFGDGAYLADTLYLCPGKEPHGLPVLVSLTLSGCTGDLDADGDVDGMDLANLLGQWGRCPVCITKPCLCPADFSGDGRVNGIDLAMLLGAWTG